MVSQIYPSKLQRNKANTSNTEAAFLDLHLSISNDISLPQFMINVTTFDFEIVNFHFQMVMVIALRPMESISLNSFVLLEHLAMLLTSTLAINCQLRNFLNKAISIINFPKQFLNFIDDTMI